MAAVAAIRPSSMTSLAGRTPASRASELDDACGRDDGEGGEVEQAAGGLDLRLLQSEPVAFEHAEDLFDAPAQTIETDDLQGVLGRLDRQRGQKPPHERLGPGRSADFARH